MKRPPPPGNSTVITRPGRMIRAEFFNEFRFILPLECNLTSAGCNSQWVIQNLRLRTYRIEERKMLPISRLIPPDTTTYDTTITIRLTFEQRDLINAVADQLGMPSSTLARHILLEAVTTLRQNMAEHDEDSNSQRT